MTAGHFVILGALLGALIVAVIARLIWRQECQRCQAAGLEECDACRETRSGECLSCLKAKATACRECWSNRRSPQVIAHIIRDQKGYDCPCCSDTCEEGGRDGE